MAKGISDARRSLERARETAERRLAEIESERSEIKKSMKALDTAIKALGETPKRPGNAKESATSEEVTSLARDCLSDGSLTADELLDRIGQTLLDQGRSRSGLKLRLLQCLKNDEFVESQGRYRLSDRPTAFEGLQQ